MRLATIALLIIQFVEISPKVCLEKDLTNVTKSFNNIRVITDIYDLDYVERLKCYFRSVVSETGVVSFIYATNICEELFAGGYSTIHGLDIVISANGEIPSFCPAVVIHPLPNVMKIHEIANEPGKLLLNTLLSTPTGNIELNEIVEKTGSIPRIFLENILDLCSVYKFTNIISNVQTKHSYVQRKIREISNSMHKKIVASTSDWLIVLWVFLLGAYGTAVAWYAVTEQSITKDSTNSGNEYSLDCEDGKTQMTTLG
ncbi:unnamed protein product [Auanema sp. JU1783]|nr:unnamed protein product [Auanema sp. JU1783]